MSDLSEWWGAAIVFALALAVGWVLSRVGILNTGSAERVSKVVTIAIAGFCSIAADVPAGKPMLIEVAGRVSIFFICYYFFGIIFVAAIMSIVNDSEKPMTRETKLPSPVPESTQPTRRPESPGVKKPIRLPPPPKINTVPQSTSLHPERYCAICRTLVLPKRSLFRGRKCPTCSSSL